MSAWFERLCRVLEFRINLKVYKRFATFHTSGCREPSPELHWEAGQEA